MKELRYECDDLIATDRLGRALGEKLRVGDMVALVGPLGSGKTTLVKSIAAGAGVPDPRDVNSPTFVIVNEYDAYRPSGPLRIYHIDTYRLRGGRDLETLGFDEMTALGLVLIEWADRVAEILPADRLNVSITPTGQEGRRFELSATGSASRRILESLADAGLSDSG